MSGLRGQLLRAAISQSVEHPEITARRDAIALAHYRLDRRRLLLDHPSEAAPPDFTDLTRGYLADYAMIAEEDKRDDG